MRNRIAIAAGLLLGLAACGEEAAAPSQDLTGELQQVRMKPGQWKLTNEIVSASAEGLPAEALQQMIGKKTVMENCITPEQAARPNADFLTAQTDGDCAYDDFKMEGGRLSGTMKCTGTQMPEMSMELDGQYGQEKFDITTDMTTRTGDMTMKVKARSTGERVGECA